MRLTLQGRNGCAPTRKAALPSHYAATDAQTVRRDLSRDLGPRPTQYACVVYPAAVAYC
jgi:hypothetical protein